jgi:hypothetical protein
MSPFGSTLEPQSCVRSINSHGSSVSMNERFARRREAAVWSFSFPLALRSADRSAARRERLSPSSWSGTTNGVTRALRAGHRIRPWTCRQITLVGSGAFDESSGSRNRSSPPRFAQRGKQLSISGNLGNGGRRRCSGNGFRISLPAPAVGKPLATYRGESRPRRVQRPAPARSRGSPHADVLGAWTFRTLAHCE